MHVQDCNSKYVEILGTEFMTVKLGQKTLKSKDIFDTAAWLAQLVERQSAVREVGGSSPRPDQHSGS